MIEIPKASDAKVRVFISYSRMESALKQAGYLKKGPRGIAQADWRRFAEAPCLADVVAVAGRDANVKAMIVNPPRTQIVTNDGLSSVWEQRLPVPLVSLTDLLEAVKQIRDNLFHGEKHGDDPRDEVLCHGAWEVIRVCLERHHEVRSLFGYRY
jgi:hypothetical protein